MWRTGYISYISPVKTSCQRFPGGLGKRIFPFSPNSNPLVAFKSHLASWQVTWLWVHQGILPPCWALLSHCTDRLVPLPLEKVKPFLYELLGAGEMALLVKCRQHKYKNLDLVPRTRAKSSMHGLSSSAPGHVGKKLANPWSSLTNRINKTDDARFSERPFSLE